MEWLSVLILGINIGGAIVGAVLVAAMLYGDDET